MAYRAVEIAVISSFVFRTQPPCPSVIGSVEETSNRASAQQRRSTGFCANLYIILLTFAVDQGSPRTAVVLGCIAQDWVSGRSAIQQHRCAEGFSELLGRVRCASGLTGRRTMRISSTNPARRAHRERIWSFGYGDTLTIADVPTPETRFLNA
jgi:hypothetical protein